MAKTMWRIWDKHLGKFVSIPQGLTRATQLCRKLNVNSPERYELKQV